METVDNRMSRSQAKSLQLQLASKTPSLDLSQLLLPLPSTGIISSCSLRLSIRMYTHTYTRMYIHIISRGPYKGLFHWSNNSWALGY